MYRVLLLVGLVCLAISLLPPDANVLPSDEIVVETYPIDPDTLQLPLPTPVAPTMAPATATSTASPERTAIPLNVVIQPGAAGYDGAHDTTIDYYAPDANACMHPSLVVASTNKAVALLRFDLTRLPDEAYGLGPYSRVLNATLSLFAVQSRPDYPLSLYIPRKDWEDCSVTWSAPWQTPGADGVDDREYDPRTQALSPRSSEWVEFDISGLVQDWLRDPAGNYGVMLKSYDPRPQQHILFSSDHPAVSLRPKLTIRYLPALPTATAVARTPTATGTPDTVPGPELGSREVEVSWPAKAYLGQAYRVRSVFRPASGSAMLATGSGEQLLVVAGSLSAPGFETVAELPDEQWLEDASGSLTWQWTVTPRLAGPQTLSIDLVFSWRPRGSTQPGAKGERGIWYHTRITDVIVRSEEPVARRPWQNALGLAGVVFLAGALIAYRTRRR